MNDAEKTKVGFRVPQDETRESIAIAAEDPPLPPLVPQVMDRDTFLDQEDSAEFMLLGHPGTER